MLDAGAVDAQVAHESGAVADRNFKCFATLWVAQRVARPESSTGSIRSSATDLDIPRRALTLSATRARNSCQSLKKSPPDELIADTRPPRAVLELSNATSTSSREGRGVKSPWDQMEIVNAYELLGSYRGAAELCGTTQKTVKRILEQREVGQAERRALTSNTAGVQTLIAERVRASDGRVSAKRLLPIAQAAGYPRGKVPIGHQAFRGAASHHKDSLCRRVARPERGLFTLERSVVTIARCPAVIWTTRREVWARSPEDGEPTTRVDCHVVPQRCAAIRILHFNGGRRSVSGFSFPTPLAGDGHLGLSRDWNARVVNFGACHG
jgi:hypothetical protein